MIGKLVLSLLIAPETALGAQSHTFATYLVMEDSALAGERASRNAGGRWLPMFSLTVQDRRSIPTAALRFENGQFQVHVVAEPWITTEDIEAVHPAIGITGQDTVRLQLSSETTERVQQLLAAHEGQHVAISINGDVCAVVRISAPSTFTDLHIPEDISDIVTQALAGERQSLQPTDGIDTHVSLSYVVLLIAVPLVAAVVVVSVVVRTVPKVVGRKWTVAWCLAGILLGAALGGTDIRRGIAQGDFVSVPMIVDIDLLGVTLGIVVGGVAATAIAVMIWLGIRRQILDVDL
jgi:hypothetical protein